MKMTLTRIRERGNVLIVSIIAASVLSAALIGYLQIISQQSTSVASSRAWNLAIPVLESGVEEALTQIRYHGINNAYRYTPGNLVNDNWVNFSKGRSIGGHSNWVVINTNFPPTILSYGYVSGPFKASTMVRRVRVNTRPNPRWNYAQLTKSNSVYRGTIRFDSYDPSKGPYNATTNFGHQGNVASNGNLTNDITIKGNVEIFGDVSTGPDGTVETKGGSFTISGKVNHDMNAEIDDAPPPPALAWASSVPATNNQGKTYYFATGSAYKLNSFSLGNNDFLIITNAVTIWVTGDIDSRGEIIITNGGSLTLYNGTLNSSPQTQTVIHGLANMTGNATNFTYYGLKSNTSVELKGNSGFTGLIYAPYAHLDMNGGGDFFGATVSNTADVTGNYNFHYPEDLRTLFLTKFVIASWNEF